MLSREHIRHIRESLGLSQKDVAEKLNLTGSTYSSVERGDTELTVERAEKLAKIFGISVGELLNLDGSNALEKTFIKDTESEELTKLKAKFSTFDGKLKSLIGLSKISYDDEYIEERIDKIFFKNAEKAPFNFGMEEDRERFKQNVMEDDAFVFMIFLDMLSKKKLIKEIDLFIFHQNLL